MECTGAAARGALAQAGVYWLSARRWVCRAPMPARFAIVYRAFRVLDGVVLAAGLVGLVFWWPDRAGAALFCTGVWCFAVVEYGNYYVVRLAYPMAQWLARVGQRRTPRLVDDSRRR
ncbi:MAG: hypothetical protein ACRC35_12990 [Angustibacter sp.]